MMGNSPSSDCGSFVFRIAAPRADAGDRSLVAIAARRVRVAISIRAQNGLGRASRRSGRGSLALPVPRDALRLQLGSFCQNILTGLGAEPAVGLLLVVTAMARAARRKSICAVSDMARRT